MIAHLIPLEEAAARLGLKPQTLIRYARSGKIGIKLFRFGEMILVETPAEEQTEREPRLVMAEGEMGITQREAERKYGVPQRTISRWIQQGLIRVISPGKRGKPYRLIEEDVAHLAEIYHAVRKESAHGFKGKRMRLLLQRMESMKLNGK
ncbi:MerR family transcriptional regulator [Thermoflexus sp.]|uniref:MerR family transcriptional regulator n=1 Tax=Thermoflexus sp. TaxID=1969742 RepID=UPI0035E40298